MSTLFPILSAQHSVGPNRAVIRAVGAVSPTSCMSVYAQSAEDILGETFVTALVRWDSFDPDRQDPLPWLFGIASNLLRRHWRSQRRADRAMSRVAASERLDDDAGERLDTERAVRTVVRELDRMRPAVRETVLLHAWAELTYEQISEATGVPVGTVRSRLNRARAALRAVPGTTDSLNGPLHV